MKKDINNLFPNGLAGIIYDCDGVMINSAAANRFLYNAILAELHLPPITKEQELYAFQATFQEALRMLVPQKLWHKLEEICQSAIDYDRDILPKIRLMPGYVEFIQKARAAGVEQAIDTNRTDPGIHKVLDFFKLPDYFNPVISSTNTEPKPSPEGVRKICHSWRVNPDRTLFIGDSPDDFSAAKGGGAVFAGFGGLEGDISVRSWEELSEILWPAS